VTPRQLAALALTSPARRIARLVVERRPATAAAGAV
jgi:hypothetical protein